MDRWSFGGDEVLYALLGVRLGEVGCCDVWELHKHKSYWSVKLEMRGAVSLVELSGTEW